MSRARAWLGAGAAIALAAWGCSRDKAPESAGTATEAPATPLASTGTAPAPSAGYPVRVNASSPPSAARRRELEEVIDDNVGYAHLKRGMNMQTIDALDRSATAADFPVLAEILLGPDRVRAMTAAEVLKRRGALGRPVLEAAAGRVKAQDPERYQLIEERLRPLLSPSAAP